MANTALAGLETALRARKLDRTLTTALPPLERRDASALIATDVAALDACLRGGVPRGQLSEIVGPHSSGRTTLVLQAMAASTRRGEIAAFVDTFDRLDVASAAARGNRSRSAALGSRVGPASSTRRSSEAESGAGPDGLSIAR